MRGAADSESELKCFKCCKGDEVDVIMLARINGSKVLLFRAH